MINRSDFDQKVGDAVHHGVDKQKSVLLTLGENPLVHKAAGTKRVLGVQPTRGAITRSGVHGLRTGGTRRLSPAASKDMFPARIAGDTLRLGGSTTRPDGEQLPTRPEVFVVSTEGQDKRVSKGNLRPEIQLYLFDKRMHFGNPAVFLGTQLDGEDVVLSLSVPCCGLLEALLLGHVNRQMTIYHPTSKGCLQVPDSRELSRIAAACACAQRKTLSDVLACVEASLLQPPQDVHVAVLDLITTIRSMPAADVTAELLAQLGGILDRASKVDGGYASWFGVAFAHAVHQRNAASSTEPSGQAVLQAAV